MQGEVETVACRVLSSLLCVDDVKAAVCSGVQGDVETVISRVIWRLLCAE